MSNTLLTISKITNEALMVLENELVFTKGVTREYEDQFAVVGAKIGATVNVRRPARFIGTTGPALNVEDFVDTYIPVVLTTQFHVDTQFTTQDLALSMDMFSQRVLKPKVAAIANKIDRDGLVMAKNNTGNIIGTVGTIPTGLRTYLDAGAYLDSEGTPRDGQRTAVIEPFTASAIVDSLKGLFLPQETIAEQYRKGLMGRDSGGMDWRMDQNVVQQSFGTTSLSSLPTVTVSGGSQGLASGWAQFSTLTFSNSSGTTTINAGDTFTISGVNAVNPQNRQTYGKARSFVATGPVTQVGAGTFTVTVAPALIFGGQFQNCTASPSGGAAVTFTSLGLSSVSTTGAQNVLFHRDAFTLAVADLELPEGVHFAGRASDKEIGLSIRVVRQYTINNDAIPTRLDVLYGWAPLYQEMACRVTS